MASYAGAPPQNLTLTGTTVDTVIITGAQTSITVLNRGTTDMWVTFDGTTPVAETAGVYPLPAGATFSKQIVPPNTQAVVFVNLLGNGNKYSILGGS